MLFFKSQKFFIASKVDSIFVRALTAYKEFSLVFWKYSFKTLKLFKAHQQICLRQILTCYNFIMSFNYMKSFRCSLSRI